MKNLGELQSKRGYEEEESNFKVTLQQHMWKNVVVGVRRGEKVEPEEKMTNRDVYVGLGFWWAYCFIFITD